MSEQEGVKRAVSCSEPGGKRLGRGRTRAFPPRLLACGRAPPAGRGPSLPVSTGDSSGQGLSRPELPVSTLDSARRGSPASEPGLGCRELSTPQSRRRSRGEQPELSQGDRCLICFNLLHNSVWGGGQQRSLPFSPSSMFGTAEMQGEQSCWHWRHKASLLLVPFGQLVHYKPDRLWGVKERPFTPQGCKSCHGKQEEDLSTQTLELNPS